MKAVFLIIKNGWLRFARLIGKVNAWLLLTAVFYAVLTPLALLRRALAKLFRKQEAAGTTWQDRSYTFTPADLEKMW